MDFAMTRLRVENRSKAIVTKLLFCLLLLAANTAFAQGECVANFKVSGDPRNGSSYVTYVTIPRLDIHSALGQMEKIALDAGFVTGAENYEGDVGTLTIVKKGKSSFLHQEKGFPAMIKADKGSNRLIMALQLNQGQTSTTENMQGLMCGMLAHVSMDSAGADIAAAAHAQTHSDEIINTTATELASKLTRHVFGRALNPEDIQNQYTGRVYRIDGQITITAPLEAYDRSLKLQDGSRSIDIQYDTSKVKTGLLATPVGAQVASITCHTDPKQLNRFVALRNGDYATLVGKVVQVSANQEAASLYLDCHFEN